MTYTPKKVRIKAKAAPIIPTITKDTQLGKPNESDTYEGALETAIPMRSKRLVMSIKIERKTV